MKDFRESTQPAGLAEEAGSGSGAAAFERALWGLVARLGHRSVVARTAASTGHALPASAWALLEHLHHAGPMRVTDIAACIGVELSAITPRLQMLEAENLVLRHRDARDGRVWVIKIGREGREALRGLHRARLELFSDALTAADMAELPRMTDMLERIAQSLQTGADAPVADHRNEAER